LFKWHGSDPSAVTAKSEPQLERLQFFSQRHRPVPMRIARWHTQVELNYLEQGDMTYLMNGRLVQLTAGRLGVFWGAGPHQVIEAHGHSGLTVIYLPLGDFLRLPLGTEFRQLVMGGSFLRASHSYPVDRGLFSRWHRDLERKDQTWTELVRDEVGARLRRMAISGYEAIGSEARDSGSLPDLGDRNLERVRRMTAFIAENFNGPLTVDDVARVTKLHPNYAITLFRKVTGMTVRQYLTRQRLSLAQSLLITTNLAVPAIAAQSGFGSLSQFYEVFGKRFSKTPRTYRIELADAAIGLRAPAGFDHHT
jgi:AraC-like DNA-binding protein